MRSQLFVGPNKPPPLEVRSLIISKQPRCEITKDSKHLRCPLFHPLYLVFIVSTLFSNSKSLLYRALSVVSLFHPIQLERANTGDVVKRITGRIPCTGFPPFPHGGAKEIYSFFMETSFDSRIIKVEHRVIFERISNTSGQCVSALRSIVLRPITLDSPWKHLPISRHTSSTTASSPVRNESWTFERMSCRGTTVTFNQLSIVS